MNIIDQNALLTSKQKALLRENANKIFMFGDFRSLDDIVKRLKVDVIIEQGIPMRSVDDYYEKAIKYWRSMYEQLYKKSQEDDTLRAECQKIEVKLGKLKKVEREAHSSMRLLGLYDSQKNAIKLFPEAMAKADASKMDEYLVSTFAHEVMHAYFNRPEHEKYPYAMFVEEPLAEFGMLLYLHETSSPYYEWAHNTVSDKKCCYGYGAVIMDQYMGGETSLKTYLEEYKIPIGEYQMPDLSNGSVTMPKEGDFVDVADQPFVAEWIPVYDVPPTYFWDDTTKTLGLDGNWRSRHDLSGLVHILLHYRLNSDIEHLYIGKDFICDRTCRDFDLDIPTIVSPKHKELTSINGILVRKEDYKDIESFGEGYFKLKKDDKWGIIDSKLKPITPFQYDKIKNFDENDLCEVMIENRWGLLNKEGVEQVPVKYDEIGWFNSNELYKVRIGSSYGLVNKEGVEQVPVKYEQIEKLEDSNEFYVAESNGKLALIDLNNNPITQFKYDEIWWFDSNDLCKVRIGKNCGLVNKQGVEQVPVEYDDFKEMYDNSNTQNDTRYYKAFLNNRWGIIDSYNNKITQIRYDESIYCRHEFDENGLCEVKIGKFMGLVNKQGVEQIPVVYEGNIIRYVIKYTRDGEVTRKECEYKVKQNGEEFRINKYGRKIDENGKILE